MVSRFWRHAAATKRTFWGAGPRETRNNKRDAGASIGLLLQPGCDRRVVIVAHRRDDHVVRARGISPVEAGEILRHLDLQRGIQEDAAATRRHHLHVDNAGTLQDRMRQQEVGCLGAFIQGEDCDHRLARATRLQSLYEGLRLASAIAALTGVGATGTPAPQPASANRPNDRPSQRVIIRCSVESHGETYACPRRATRTGPSGRRTRKSSLQKKGAARRSSALALSSTWRQDGTWRLLWRSEWGCWS